METKKCIKCGKEVPADGNGSSLVMEEDLGIGTTSESMCAMGIWVRGPIHVRTRTTFELTHPEGAVFCPRCAVQILMYSAQKALAQHDPCADPFGGRG